MKITCAADFLKEEGKILFFGEPGEMGGVFQPDVDDSPDSCFLEDREEPAGRLSAASDGIKGYIVHSAPSCSVPVFTVQAIFSSWRQ